MSLKKFSDIITENSIEIPVIQRDYVQGLDEKKAKRFLEAIKAGIDGKGLHLDFIFGSKKSEENGAGRFIPIDGQQRLTTLFLLYFYLSLEEKYMSQLRHLTYAVRPSSEEFFKALCKEEHWQKLTRKDIVRQIKNSSWYFLSWERDLSVQSALKMLQMIEERFASYKPEDLEKIGFEFLDLAEYGLDEDLYIKMNARGKQLSNFENFKAEFEKYIDDLATKSKLDNEWLDIFWKLGFEEAEKLFYLFFFHTTLHFYAQNYELDKNFIKQKELFDFYEEVYKDPNNVKSIVKLLDNLSKYKNLKAYCTEDIDYAQRLDFHIWSLGVLKDFDDIQMRRWQRIAKNLIRNTRVEEGDAFVKALRGLRALADTITFDVYKEIDFSSLGGVNTKQKEEERRKVALINKNERWEKVLIEAEEHWYLEGQVGFLIDYAKEDLEAFKKYKEKFFILFKGTVQKDKKAQTHIQRALLTIEDYLPSHDWRKKTFCTFDTRLRVKEENWRKVFGKESFKTLLDQIDTFEDLFELIDTYVFDVHDWKSFFINPKEHWSVLEDTRHFQIVFEDEERIFLNAGDTKPDRWKWRNAKELYTWYIFRAFFKLKPREKREIKWRLEAEVDKRYGLIYYWIAPFGSGEAGIGVEKGEKIYEIKKDPRKKEIVFTEYESQKVLKRFLLEDILSRKVDLMEEIAVLRK